MFLWSREPELFAPDAEGAVVVDAAGGVPAPAATVLGPAPVGAQEYFCATVGAMDELAVMASIESQRWDEDVDGFTVTTPTEP